MSHSENRDLSTGLEPLEPRQMLAGNVTATINGAGDLIVNGDGDDNIITVAIDQFGNVEVTGEEGTTVDDSGLLDSQVTGDVKINLKGGNDEVSLYGVASGPVEAAAPIDLPIDNVIIKGGGGDDSIFASNLYGVEGNVKLITGGGDDTAVVKYAGISGDLSISTAGGDDTGVAAATYANNIKMTTGGGSDYAAIYDSFAEEKVSVSVGSGDNSINIAGTAAYEGFSLKSGGGSDYMAIDGSYAKYGDMAIVSGGGDDIILIIDSSVSGELNVRTGGGNDNATVKYQGPEPPLRGGESGSQIDGFKFNMGGGDDSLGFIGNVNGNGTANGAGGTDSLFRGSTGDLTVDDSNFEVFDT